MFPDKYEIYVGSDEKTIIDKMLKQFNIIMGEKYISRAEELGYTIDEIMTLASIIEKEAKPADFSKVAAVFLNRLERDMPLESDVTVHYVNRTNTIMLSGNEIAVDSPYNTYKYKGIPIGPICAPSQKAIDAVLYPDEDFLDDGYLYFVSTDPESGVLEFNITYEGHQSSVEKYRPLWEAFTAANS